ncbi:MAG: hypothetical protein COT17_03325 [Elusimicrobia bacterium CG08_land_8_20_14_0_20_51_18]|nr:MAG: hypothetical protein COT17_03325 [Elusimicrobia bacterium CG08_land_8_20_14_0_20_51_18]
MPLNYDRKYFLTECEGFNTFLSSKGLKLSPRLRRIHKEVFGFRPGKVLDFGCGRGELALNFALGGAETYGVDVSAAALELSNEIKAHWLKNSPQMRLEFLKLEEERLPFESGIFDVVIFSDIAEHLETGELANWLAEAFRVLKTGGHIAVHTSPNRIFLNWGLRLYWFVGFFNGVRLGWNMKAALPEGLRDGFHVNEQTASSLEKALKKSGFSGIKTGFWKNPHYVYYFLKDDRFIMILNRLYRFLPFKQLFFADLFVTAKK